MGDNLGNFFSAHAAEVAKSEPTMQCYFSLPARTMKRFLPRNIRDGLILTENEVILNSLAATFCGKAFEV